MYSVVLIDDEPWVLAGIRAIFPFKQYGFEVVEECSDVDSAFTVIKNVKPDLIITDIRLGQKNGLDLINMCNESQIESHFVILSAYDYFEYAKQALALGASYYMLKPIKKFEATEILRKINLKLNKNLRGNEENILTTSNQINKLMEYIETHSSEKLTLEQLSEVFYLNKTYICDLFHKHTNKTFIEFLNGIRVEKACNLLKYSNLQIRSISDRVGFEDARYFSRIFKTFKGCSPVDFRTNNPHKVI